jgi:hypothetical protein
MHDKCLSVLVSAGVDAKAAERFADKVDEDAAGCWIWQASLGRGGYPRQERGHAAP